MTMLLKLLTGLLIIMAMAASVTHSQTIEVSPKVSFRGRTVRISCTGFQDGKLAQVIKLSSPDLFTIQNENEIKAKTNMTVPPADNVTDSLGALKKPWSNYDTVYSSNVTGDTVTFTIKNANVEDSGYYGCLTSEGSVSNGLGQPLLIYNTGPLENIKLYKGSRELLNETEDGKPLSCVYDPFKSTRLNLALVGIEENGNVILRAKFKYPSPNSTIQQSRIVSQESDYCPWGRQLCRYSVKLIIQLQIDNIAELHYSTLQLQLQRPHQDDVAWYRNVLLLDKSKPHLNAEAESLDCQPKQQTVRHGAAVTIGCSVPTKWLGLNGFTATWRVAHDMQFNPMGSVSCSYPNFANVDPQLRNYNKIMQDVQKNSCNNRFFSALDLNFIAESNNAVTNLYVSIPYAGYVQNNRSFTLTLSADASEMNRDISSKFFIRIEPPAATDSAITSSSSKLLMLAVALMLVLLNLVMN